MTYASRKAEDKKVIELLSIIMRGATDERNFVKKALNWALRNIGKRNSNLNRAAINAAKRFKDLIRKLPAGSPPIPSGNLRVKVYKQG